VTGRIDIGGGSARLDWAVAQRAKVAGHSGDGYMLLRDGDIIRAVVIDGLGSGLEAEAAADIGLHAVRQARESAPLAHMFTAAHLALEKVRGAAMAVASITLKDMAVSWAAVGDIDGLHMRCGAPNGGLIQKSGTLGICYSGVRPVHVDLDVGDVLVLTTDGVRRSYRSAPQCSDRPQDFADAILRDYGRENDDCLALVLRLEAAP